MTRPRRSRRFATSRLPECFDVVGREAFVAGNETSTFQSPLRHEQSIEGVGMMRWKLRYRQRMTRVDREEFEPIRTGLLGDERVEGFGELESPAAGLDGDFPATGRTEVRLVAPVADSRSRPVGQLGVIGHPPEEGVARRRELNGSSSSRTTAG